MLQAGCVRAICVPHGASDCGKLRGAGDRERERVCCSFFKALQDFPSKYETAKP